MRTVPHGKTYHLNLKLNWDVRSALESTCDEGCRNEIKANGRNLNCQQLVMVSIMALLNQPLDQRLKTIQQHIGDI